MELRSNRWKTVTVFALMTSMTFPVQAAFDGPGVESDPYHGYGQERWEALNDNVIEYEELGDLVWEFNPSIVAGDSAVKSGIDHSKFMARAFYDDSKKYTDMAEELKSSGTLDHPEVMMQYQMLLATSKRMQNQGESLNRSAGYSERATSGSYKSLRKAGKMVTNFAQQAMMGYHSAVAQRATVEKMRELYSSLYDSTVLQQQLSMATQTDVLAAQMNLLSAESMLGQLDLTIDSLRRTLCMMTGWAADAQPDICPVPPVNMDRVQAIDLEKDTQKAIDNNNILIAERGSKTTSSTQYHNAERLNSEGEQKVKIEMQSLYQDIQKTKSDWEAADTAYQGAVLAKNASDRQFQLGMVSKTQYIAQQLEFVRSESELETARLRLVQVLQAYDRAVDGFAEIE